MRDSVAAMVGCSSEAAWASAFLRQGRLRAERERTPATDLDASPNGFNRLSIARANRRAVKFVMYPAEDR